MLAQNFYDYGYLNTLKFYTNKKQAKLCVDILRAWFFFYVGLSFLFHKLMLLGCFIGYM